MEVAQAIISYLCYISMRNTGRARVDLADVENQVQHELVSSKFIGR